MPKTKYHLSFTEHDIEKLNSVLSESDPASKLHLRANVLLALERSTHTHMTTLAIAKECNTSDTTVQTIRTKYALYGLDEALYAAHLLWYGFLCTVAVSEYLLYVLRPVRQAFQQAPGFYPAE